MSSDQRPSSTRELDHPDEVRDIYALTPPQPTSRGARGEPWEIGSRSSTLSLGTEVDNFSTMSREFSALVVAGSTMQDDNAAAANSDAAANLERIREEEPPEETNPLAIVADRNPIASPRASTAGRSTSTGSGSGAVVAAAAAAEEVSVHRVKKEEVESKIGAWQTAEIAKINNRFKRQDVIINGWESEQVEKANARLKKIERKLDEKRARAVEKMQNEVAKAHRKAEEKRASADAKRGTKVAKILDMSSLFRAVGRAPKRSIF